MFNYAHEEMSAVRGK